MRDLLVMSLMRRVSQGRLVRWCAGPSAMALHASKNVNEFFDLRPDRTRARTPDCPRARRPHSFLTRTEIGIGIVVDTQVTRVSARIGLTATGDVVKIEQDLMALIPQKEWTNFSHRVITYGRTICIARKPKCAQRALNDLCPSAEEPPE
jgi:endonuclease-3